MGAKYQNLKGLLELGINTHEFVSLSTVEELIDYEKKNPMFSIRFDRNKNYQQLPFYKYNREDFHNKKDKEEFFEKIVIDANSKKCTLLCSNGYSYDSIQICNFVFKTESKHDFVLEWSTKEVSLREMYEYTTTILKGNIKDDIKDMEWINKKENKLDKKEIEKILSWAFSLNIIDKSIEATLYKKKVGVIKEEIVCWQTV